jgi:hypothetical protein
MNGYANYECIRFHYNKHTCEESNIINNSQGTSDYGTFCNHETYKPTTKIIKCCIINNNAIGKGTYLFYATGGTMLVKESTLQKGYSTKGSITLTNNILLNFYNFIENVKKCNLLFLFSNVKEENDFKNTVCDLKNCEAFFLDKIDEIFKTLFGNIVINSIS